MNKIIALLMLALALLPAGCFGQKVPTVKVTLNVEDENGKPIAGADAGMAGDLNTPENGPVPSHGRGPTNQDGKFTMEVATVLGKIAVGARGKGYYDGDDGKGTEGTWLTTDNDARKAAYKSGKWEPWEREIKVVLRPIKNPVPMYVKHIHSELPKKNEWLGFDLELCDWIAPYGKGKTCDIEFYAENEFESHNNFHGTLRIRFSRPGDGIQPYDWGANRASVFKMPYEAPQNGYQSTWEWKARRALPKGATTSTTIDESRKHDEFIYCIRSKLDKDGNVIEGRYGRFQGPFLFGARGKFNNGETCSVDFTNYFNPNGTRNLEFDPKQNLFTEEKQTFGP